MFEATLEVRLPACWVSRLADTGSRVRVLDRKVTGGTGMKSLFEVVREKGTRPWEELLAEVRDHPSVRSVRAVTNDDERLLCIVHCADCQSCRAVVTSECFVTGAVSRGTAMDWTVRFDDRVQLANLVESLRRKKAEVTVTRIVPVHGGSTLTRRQTEVLRSALEMGYFDFPKRAGVEALASRLGVSKSTVCETLRRAQFKALQAYVDGRP